jgi:hypothetical protein
MWSRVSTLLICTKRAQGTQSKSHFASNHFAKKLVMISAD